MNVQFVLTTNELKAILAHHYNLPGSVNMKYVTVVITEDGAAAATNLWLNEDHWNQLRYWNETAHMFPRRKLEAIREVQAAYPNTSEIDAKCAVEGSWKDIKDYVKLHDTLRGVAGMYGYTV
jgi:hypothetical protein